MSHSRFFSAPKYNHIGRQQLWINACIFSHDAWCGCDCPIAHLIDSLLPIGHKDRDLTVKEILSRDYQVRCRSGGQEEESGGPGEDLPTEEGPTNEELEEIFTENALEELLDAAANDEGPR